MDANCIDNLIDHVKLHPCLYNKDQTSKLSAEQKNKLWVEIADSIGSKPEKCKAKWRNLRDSYQKALRRKLELHAVDKGELYNPYRHELKLGFLEKSIMKTLKRKHTKSPSNESNLSQQEYSDPSEEVEYLTETDNNVITTEKESVQTRAETPEPISEVVKIEEEQYYYEAETTSNPDNSSYHQTVPNEAFNQLQRNQETEIDAWISSIKETLMSLPNLLRAKAKRDISMLVSDFEIKYLESLD